MKDLWRVFVKLALGVVILAGSVPCHARDREQPRFAEEIRTTSRSSGDAPEEAKVSAAAGDNDVPSTPLSQPPTLFDVVSHRLNPVVVSVEVRETRSDTDTEPQPFTVGSQQILLTAGSYGDVLRFMQSLPGVVATSDTSNQFLVRGGHPMENLFLVEGIEVPNINHLATLATSGGFAPMLDAATIQSLKVYTGGYDANFPERLSSVTEIRLLNRPDTARVVEGDFGIQGVGGLIEQKLKNGDLLSSAHHGLLDVVSHDAGMNGVPSYTNEMVRYRRANGAGDHLTLLHIGGWDSIDVTPCESDQAETSSINSQYAGWRETTAVEWQHIFSQNSFAVAGIGDSEQVEHIHQQEQYLDPTRATPMSIPCPIPARYRKATPVYGEDTNNAFSSASFRYNLGFKRFSMVSGTTAWLQRPNFSIDQPEGAFSPYSAAPFRTDATSFHSAFSTGETGTFTQLTLRATNLWTLSGGARLQTFAFGSHATLTPRVSLKYRVGEAAQLHATYAEYAQLPPYVYLLAYPSNRNLLPMRSKHQIVGAEFAISSSQFRIEAYSKQYADTPAASEYPGVTLHDMADLLGEQFVWLPMNSNGRGKASGIELSNSTRVGTRVFLAGSLAYSRAKFAGMDGILRPGNFDLPWIANISGTSRLGRGYVFSARFGFASGRPFTSYDMRASLTQNRPIYDLMHVNAFRAPDYSRLDVQINKEILLHQHHLELYGGVDNVLNRSNFLTYAWMPIADLTSPNRNPLKELHQMPIFPNFGIRFILR